MSASTFTVGDDVIPADHLHHVGMIQLCDTYHHGVTHGRVVAVMPEYADSIYVVWWTSQGPQTIAYGLHPSTLQHD